MKTKLHYVFMLLLFYSFMPHAFATDYYTASSSATLVGNSGAVNANWTTNPDGITGLTNVAIAATDNLIILNGGTATITATTTVADVTINQGGKLLNVVNGASFNVNGTLTWNGTIKTTASTGYFSLKGDIVGTTAIHDAGSTTTIFISGAGKKINLTQLSTGVTTSGNRFFGLQLSDTNTRTLSGNCKFYTPLYFGTANSSLDLNGYDLQVSSIKNMNSTAYSIKGNVNSKLTISAADVSTNGNQTVLIMDPATAVLNELNINQDYLAAGTAAATVTVNGNLTVNTLKFGSAAGDKTRILKVNGNFTLANNGGTMRMQVGGSTAGSGYDQLSATGTISIGASTTLKLDMIGGIDASLQPTLTLANSTSTNPNPVSGTFGTVQVTSAYTGNVAYTPTTVQYQLLTGPPPKPACSMTMNPDLPLVPSNSIIEAEINTIIKRFSDGYLGTSEPTTTELNNAIASYNALNITVNGYSISSGTAVTGYGQTTFLKTFAQYLKFHPNNPNSTNTSTDPNSPDYPNYIYTMALNAVWLVSDRVCKGTLAIDGLGYGSIAFTKPAILIPAIKNNSYVKSLFESLLYRQRTFNNLWKANPPADGIDDDIIGNNGYVIMGYVNWIDSADERYRYMTAFKRELENYPKYTPGTSYCGLKPDGSFFHHWGAYPGYSYNLSNIVGMFSNFTGTSFQISSVTYLQYREAIMHQLMLINDNNTKFLTLSGRKPDAVTGWINMYSVRSMAIAGGDILGTGTSDPQLTTLQNRIWGTYGPLGNNTVAPFNEGFFQFNHSMAGVYRKNGWVATCKGFSNNMFGAEIFGITNGVPANRFGRYQSYGAVNVVYPGDALTGNGYDVKTWDWNFTPGATVIRLPWNKLEAENSEQEERQQKRFVGSLSFINKNGDYLKNVQGTYGLFAMDFQENIANGWSTRYSPESHNPTFTFKKSVFAFDDMLICLGSGINNNDATNNTLTALYQRKAITGKQDVNADGNLLQGNYSNSYAEGSGNHWIVDNFSTGFYVFSGSGTIKLTRADQQTPQHNQMLSAPNPPDITQNPIGNYAIGYLDHGTAPSNKGYEYVCMPKATAADMTALGSQIDAGNKPYTVYRKDEMAHIVEYKPTAASNSIFGYAFFSALSGINNTGQLTGADYPCLVMSQYDATQKSLKMAVNNPDLGFAYRVPNPSVDKKVNITIKGTNWQISQPNSRASITGTANGETTIQFTVVDGLPVEIVLSRVLTPQTITFEALPTKAITDTTFDLTATASSNLAVSYTSSNPEVATVSGSTVTIVGKGTTTISAKQDGDDIYSAAEAVEQTLRVNTEPTVTITSPSANANFESLANITITVNALDADGSVSKVEFFNGDIKLGEATSTPYSLDWNNVAPGSYTISAKATDNDNGVTTSEVINVNVVCPTVQLSIPDVYAMNPAIDDANTIYLGYGPTSVTLNSLVQGNQEVTYTWSTGAQTPSISVSQAGTYTVTATYAGGCQSTASITINTLDVRCGNNNDKVMICHNNTVICVAQSAVQTHLDHGDNLGSCSGTSKMEIKEETTTSSNFTVYPNPVQDNLNVSVSSKLDPNATIGIYNTLGIKIRQVRFVAVPQTVFIGDLPSGNYIVVIQNGVETFRSTIVKQ